MTSGRDEAWEAEEGEGRGHGVRQAGGILAGSGEDMAGAGRRGRKRGAGPLAGFGRLSAEFKRRKLTSKDCK